MSFLVKEVVRDFVAHVDDFPFQAFSQSDIQEIQAVWRKYPVVRFRNAQMTDLEQIAFTKALGRIYVSKQIRSGQHEDHPEILVVANKKHADGSPAGELGDGEVMWHTDQWWTNEPPSAALLRALEVPTSGGNTYFANMYTAYETLPEETKARIRGLYIHHQDEVDIFGEPRAGHQRPSTNDFAAWSGVDHPIVRLHAETGKPCLYLGAGRKWQAIVGMNQGDADQLLDSLWEHAVRPEHCWHQEWQMNDMMMWDNRCLMHYRDPFDPRSKRTMHRTTVMGERPLAAA
jgi:taurine dioxygenase